MTYGNMMRTLHNQIFTIFNHKSIIIIRKYKGEEFHREAVLFNNIFKTFHISPFASIDRFDLVKNHLQMEDYDPGKICGLLIKNIQDKHYGNWT